MKFLVLFIISLMSLPKSHLIVRLDLFFISWQTSIAKILPKVQFYIIFFLSIVFPLLIIFLILYFLNGVLWNIPLFFTTLVFLYYALDNRKDLTWLARYTKAYYKHNEEKLHLYAYKLLESNNLNLNKPSSNEEIQIPTDYFDDPIEKQKQLLQKVIWLGFETFFLPLFWYLVSTPLSPIFVKLLEISIKNQQAKGKEVGNLLLKIQKFLHWFPARFFGLTMTFVALSSEEFKTWLRDIFNFNISTEDYLYSQVKAYLLFNSYQEDSEIFSDKAQKDLLVLKDLLWRTLALWLGIVAVIVIIF